MAAIDQLDAALSPETREDRIVAAALRLIEATNAARRAEDEWTELHISESGIRSQKAQKAARLAYTLLEEACEEEK